MGVWCRTVGVMVLAGHIFEFEYSTVAGPKRAAPSLRPSCTEHLEAGGVRGEKGGENEEKSGSCICGQLWLGMQVEGVVMGERKGRGPRVIDACRFFNSASLNNRVCRH